MRNWKILALTLILLTANLLTANTNNFAVKEFNFKSTDYFNHNDNICAISLINDGEYQKIYLKHLDKELNIKDSLLTAVIKNKNYTRISLIKTPEIDSIKLISLSTNTVFDYYRLVDNNLLKFNIPKDYSPLIFSGSKLVLKNKTKNEFCLYDIEKEKILKKVIGQDLFSHDNQHLLLWQKIGFWIFNRYELSVYDKNLKLIAEIRGSKASKFSNLEHYDEFAVTLVKSNNQKMAISFTSTIIKFILSKNKMVEITLDSNKSDVVLYKSSGYFWKGEYSSFNPLIYCGDYLICSYQEVKKGESKYGFISFRETEEERYVLDYPWFIVGLNEVNSSEIQLLAHNNNKLLLKHINLRTMEVNREEKYNLSFKNTNEVVSSDLLYLNENKLSALIYNLPSHDPLTRESFLISIF